MGIVVNPDVVADSEESGAATLPEGVYRNEQDEDWKCPDPERVELFRTDAKIFTAPKSANPQVVFRYLRAMRKGAGDAGMAELLYEVLGEPIMDALADEKLTESEFKAVMGVVEAHAMKATKRVLGKS
jgi:hypothetical protein